MSVNALNLCPCHNKKGNYIRMRNKGKEQNNVIDLKGYTRTYAYHSLL